MSMPPRSVSTVTAIGLLLRVTAQGTITRALVSDRQM